MMLVLWLLLGSVWFGSASISVLDDVDGKIRGGFYYPEIINHLTNGGEERWIKQYFGKNSKIVWIDENNKYYAEYKKILERGTIEKGLTFNVYDDEMRNEAIALFKLLKSLDIETFHVTVAWASININSGILEYALRLVTYYSEDFKYLHLPAPFIVKPNHFFSTEAIRKALNLKLNHGIYSHKEAKVYQYYRINDTIVINTNYSGWNLLGNGCFEKLRYFREDIGLNSFYYGVHLTHPFWMSNIELENMNSQQIEQYYFTHQQLLARYFLEAEANRISEQDVVNLKASCNFPHFNPNLQHDNGLSFPVRFQYNTASDNELAAYLNTINLIVKELADKGMNLVKIYEMTLNMTEDNYLETVSKMIRVNIDGIKYSKYLRSLYGANGYPPDEYNPSPSAMHYPETSLRDPLYWSLLNSAMINFKLFKAALPPHNMSEYETEDFKLSITRVSKLSTRFEPYQTDITGIIPERHDKHFTRHLTFTTRQKRLSHSPFVIDMVVDSSNKTEAIFRMFIGPRCHEEDCFKQFNRWFELDTFKYPLKEGLNSVTWNSTNSERYGKDISCNMEGSHQYSSRKEKLGKCMEEYDMFKFPERLILPQGSSHGFSLSLFVIVTKNTEDLDFLNGKLLPLGFPFDHSLISYNIDAYNYAVQSIVIHHSGVHEVDFIDSVSV